MKSLIILKGLVKTSKEEWVYSQGLENFFLDIDVVRRLYSTPELVTPNSCVLGRSFGTQVHQKFMEILCTRLSKGCLIVIDMEGEATTTAETLATIFGYEIFYVIQPIPQDYCAKPKKYSIPWYVTKKREDLELEVKNFLNLHFDSKNKIYEYQDLLDYWKNKEAVVNLTKDNRVLHVSDIHSNYSLFKKINLYDYDYIICHGDYIDGPEVGGSRKMMDEILKSPPSTRKLWWVEGNHELRLRRYLGWKYLKDGGKKYIADNLLSDIPEEFILTTGKEFDDLGPGEAWNYIKDMNKKLRTHVLLERDEEVFICTHAGLKYTDQIQPKYIGNVIYGNRDMDRYDREFSGRNKRNNVTSIHAHCKYPSGWCVNKYPGVFNIDPENETKVVTLENNNWKVCLLEK